MPPHLILGSLTGRNIWQGIKTKNACSECLNLTPSQAAQHLLISYVSIQCTIRIQCTIWQRMVEQARAGFVCPLPSKLHLDNASLGLGVQRSTTSVISMCSLGSLHWPPKSSARPKLGRQKLVAITTMAGCPACRGCCSLTRARSSRCRGSTSRTTRHLRQQCSSHIWTCQKLHKVEEEYPPAIHQTASS